MLGTGRSIKKTHINKLAMLITVYFTFAYHER
jgi:hypothetical protein